MSEWVLARLVSDHREQLRSFLARLPSDGAAAYAAILDLLQCLPASDLAAATSDLGDEVGRLSPEDANQFAALVEQAHQACGLTPPSWAREVKPLAQPYFGTDLQGLRIHLLLNAPVAFRRRNVFVDSGYGDRV